MSTGRVIASKYCLLYELGRGGMGAVWVAEHLTLRTKVAIKLIDPILAANVQAVTRFEREARAAALLRSPHVVQVFDFGVDGGSPYLAMELLEGESLAARLAREVSLTRKDVAAVMNQLARAVTRAHSQGFVHRDLKPDNVFLVDDGDDFFVKVLDFGIAKALRPTPTLADNHLTATGALLGSPCHMSPEQAEGRTVDHRSDLWSMGVIAFECLTGVLPFAGDSIPAILRAICFDPVVVPSTVATVPVGFDAWFARAVARSPDERFQSAHELALELEKVLSAPLEDDAELDKTTRRFFMAGKLTFDTFPGTPADRRGEVRIPSSIPAGLNGKRDLRHTAIIHNASRTGALLATRQPCEPNQELLLTVHLDGPDRGENVPAHVVRVSPMKTSIWRFEVGIRFDQPLSDALLRQIEQRVEQSSR